MRPGRTRDGFILVTVLWTIALLSALALGVATTFRGYSGIVAVEQDRTKATELLTAGLAVAGDRLQRLDKRPLTQRETTIALGTGAVRIDLSDETGRININKAPLDVLTSMLRSVGAPNAEAVAASIVAWRSQKTGGVSTQVPNAAIRLPGAPANDGGQGQHFFMDIRQLALIPGVTQDDIVALTPLTTVYGGDKVNALTAPADVLASLPGMDVTQRDALLAARQSDSISDMRLQQIVGPAQKYLTLKAQPIALARLTAQLPDGYTRVVRAVIVCLPKDTLPYRVLAWDPVALSGATLAERF